MEEVAEGGRVGGGDILFLTGKGEEGKYSYRTADES